MLPIDFLDKLIIPSIQRINSLCCIIELFAHCKGGNFGIHIWAWLTISSAKQGKLPSRNDHSC